MKLYAGLRAGMCSIILSLAVSACSEPPKPEIKPMAESLGNDIEHSTSNSDVKARPVQKILDVFKVGPTVYVRSLAVDEASNSIWVGSSLGAQEIDLNTFEIKNTFTRDDGLANEYIFAIGIDPDGYKWFGTNAGGVSRYKEGEWKTFFPMHGLADYWVYSFANAPDNSLWIGTWAGTNQLDRKSETFKTYVKELINEWVYGVAVDKQGRIWFGTEGGITRFDGSSWRHWTHSDGLGAANDQNLPYSKNTGLGTRSRHDLGIMAEGKSTYNPNYVFAIHIDAIDDTVWAGTWGGGVSHFVNDQWENFTDKDGLAGNIVYSIAQDKEGNYWFGTNRGLSRYDGQHWQNYNLHSGMPANNVYAIAVTPDGDIWVGTRAGVTRLGYKIDDVQTR